MIDYQPIKIINLGPVNIKVWGLMFALAILLGLGWTYLRAKEKEKDHILNIGFLAIVGAVIGSKLVHVIIYPESYLDILDIYKVWQGGMISYGGFLLASFLSIIYLKVNKLNIYRYTDLFAPPLALGILITRIGCFLNHCHLGKLTDLPWGLNYLGEIRHPIALYYALSALVLLIITSIIEKRTDKIGLSTLTLVTLYPILRLLADTFADYQIRSVAIANNIFLIVLALTFGYMLYKKIKKIRPERH
jgi:phosphatidylglycerol:prolipoprotein diacylglycerol transferase